MKLAKGMTFQRIINFLRYIKEDQDVLAVKLINEDLDEGTDLAELLQVKEDGFGYSLDVKRISEDTFKIKFGCQAGPTAGDGGEWTVSYNKDDNVVECNAGSSWMS